MFIKPFPTESTDSQVEGEQVVALAKHKSRPKLVVAASLYCNATFLSIFLTLQFVYALVHIRSNRVLYEEPRKLHPVVKKSKKRRIAA